MISEAMARDAPVVAAIERRRQAEMGCALPFPETRLRGPIGLAARTHRHPDLDPDPRRIAPGLLRQRAQPGEHLLGLEPRRIGVRHPAVAAPGNAFERA